MSRAAFMAGVQHATRMLVEAERIQADSLKCPSAIEAQHREGAEQQNFAMVYLSRLLLQPETLEGFAAVLSDYLGMPSSTTSAYYTKLTEPEIFGA